MFLSGGTHVDGREGVLKAVQSILDAYDINTEGTVETPLRVARMYEELLSGYTQDPMDLFKVFDSDGNDQLVLVKDIPFWSLCEHHMVPFGGMAHLGYIPKGKVLGLSKTARLVEVFSRRLQIQERMTVEIANAMEKGLAPTRGVMVVIEARHLCIEVRGVQKVGSTTTTSAVRGDFLTDPAARQEFLALLGRS